jgi:tetrapyrrole methylase family protein/MazG family protein
MKNFDKLLQLIEKLRSENGCPWDREQTIKSLKADLLSEVDEVAEAIDKEDYENLKEEIGDLIWSAALITQVAKEEKLFDMEDVLKTVNEKIVRRHPHVFGDKKAKDADEAKKIFNEAKNNEKK